MHAQLPSSYSSTRPLITRTHGTGIPLVLLHGWGLNSGVWHGVLDALCENFQVTTIDLPGFGDNAQTYPQGYALDDLAEMVVNVMPKGAIMLGWSMGGLIAQRIAIKQLLPLKALITLSSTPCFEQKDDWHGIKPQVLRLFEQQLEKDYEQTLSRFLAIQALGSPSAKAEIKLLKRAIASHSSPSINALQGGLQLLSVVDLRQQIGQIQVPTLRLYGRLDSLVPVDGIEQIQSYQPNAQSHIFPHAAHAPFISHPDDWVECILAFVQDL